jgi:hypothetical protein
MIYPGFKPGPLAQKSDVLTTVLSEHPVWEVPLGCNFKILRMQCRQLCLRCEFLNKTHGLTFLSRNLYGRYPRCLSIVWEVPLGLKISKFRVCSFVSDGNLDPNCWTNVSFKLKFVQQYSKFNIVNNFCM